MFEKFKEKIKEGIENAKTANLDTKNALDIHRKKHADRVIETLEVSFPKYYLSKDEIEKLYEITKKDYKHSYLGICISSGFWVLFSSIMFLFIKTTESLFEIIIIMALFMSGGPLISVITSRKRSFQILENIKNGDYRAFELLIDGKTTRESGGESSTTYYYIKSRGVVFQVNRTEYKDAVIEKNASIIVTEQKKGLNFQLFGLL